MEISPVQNSTCGYKTKDIAVMIGESVSEYININISEKIQVIILNMNFL